MIQTGPIISFLHVDGVFIFQTGDGCVRFLVYVSTVRIITYGYNMMLLTTHK